MGGVIHLLRYCNDTTYCGELPDCEAGDASVYADEDAIKDSKKHPEKYCTECLDMHTAAYYEDSGGFNYEQ